MLYISIYKARKQESKKIDGFLNKNHIILPVRFLIWICFIGPYNCGMYKHYSRRSLLRSLAEPL